jgi:hypothetical protein
MPTNTTCPNCRGELYADRRSVADMATRGFRGGRITCMQGCTSIWLFEPIVSTKPEIVFERYVHEERKDRLITCERCHQPTETRGCNTKRCVKCRDAMKKIRAREASRRHVERKRLARAVA